MPYKRDRAQSAGARALARTLAEPGSTADLADQPSIHQIKSYGIDFPSRLRADGGDRRCGSAAVAAPRLHPLDRSSRHADNRAPGAEARLRTRRARQPEHQPDRSRAPEDEALPPRGDRDGDAGEGPEVEVAVRHPRQEHLLLSDDGP